VKSPSPLKKPAAKIFLELSFGEPRQIARVLDMS